MAWFILTLTNLPLFVLEGMALRELKKLVYLKELACTRLLAHEAPLLPDEPDYFDNIGTLNNKRLSR